MLAVRAGRRPGRPPATGVVPGVWETIRRMARRFTGPEGPCVFPPECHAVFTLPHFMEFGYVAAGVTASGTPGTTFTLVTVPAYERWQLCSLSLWTNGGGENIRIVTYTQPSGYGSGARLVYLAGSDQTSLSTIDVLIPNGQSRITVSSLADHLLEPGAAINAGITNTPAGNTAINFAISVRVTRVVQGQSP